MGLFLRVFLFVALMTLWIEPTRADLNHVDVVDARVNSVSEPFRDKNGNMVQRVDETLTLVETMPDGSRQRSTKQLFPLIGLAIKGVAAAVKGAKVAGAIAKVAKVARVVHKGVSVVQNVKRAHGAIKSMAGGGNHRRGRHLRGRP